jgi:hypothetical protein
MLVPSFTFRSFLSKKLNRNRSIPTFRFRLVLYRRLLLTLPLFLLSVRASLSCTYVLHSLLIVHALSLDLPTNAIPLRVRAVLVWFRALRQLGAGSRRHAGSHLQAVIFLFFDSIQLWDLLSL